MSVPKMVPCAVCGAPGPDDIPTCLLCGAVRAKHVSEPVEPLGAAERTQPVEAPPQYVAPKPSGAQPVPQGEVTTKNERTRPAPSREGGLEPGAVVLGKYRVVRTLGHGGMGSVYLGHDDVTGQDVAIKALPPALAREKGIRDRFTLEAKALARLDHPSIVPLVGFAHDGEAHFLIMKFVEGPNLDHLIESSGPLPFDQVRDVFRAVVDALGHAHGKGVIHRDVKPANVLLAQDGRVYLVDFGISKGDDNVKLTQTGMLMGTPQYMSPEQISGNPVDGRSDLYAAGLVLFEMLCGRPPFVGERTFNVLKQHVEAPVPDPETVRGEPIPNDLLVVVKRLLEKDPDQRPASAEATLALLDAGIVERPSFAPTVAGTSTPPMAAETPTTAFVDDVDDALLAASVRPKRWPLVVAGVVAMLLVVGGGAFFAGRTSTPVEVEPGGPPPDDARAATRVMLAQVQKLLDEGDADAALGVLGGIPDSERDAVDVVMVSLDAALKAKKRSMARELLGRLQATPGLPDEIRAGLAERQATLDGLDDAASAAAAARRRANDRKRPESTTAALSMDQIMAVTHGPKSRTGLQECWERTVLAREPRARGVMRLEVRVKPDGRVSSTKIVQQTVGDDRFAKCVLKTARRWTFPAFKDGEEIISSEFQFVPLTD